MALNTNALISLEDMKAWLGLTITDYDMKVETYINAASQYVEKYLDRELDRQEYTENYDGVRSNRLHLWNYPADKPSSIIVSNNWDFSNADPIDVADYTITRDSVVVVKSGTFGRGNQSIQVTYKAGYNTPNAALQDGEDLPSDIRMAAILYVQWLWDKDKNKTVGYESKSKQNQNTKYVQGLPKEIDQMLENYKRTEFTGLHAQFDTF